mmetsp:Transcript_19257/g.48679  ORF Transcript_19257/g.48679 Transcript_19257/m.48679 type:complete len:195 (+) Transcript_19257:65-649(+)
MLGSLTEDAEVQPLDLGSLRRGASACGKAARRRSIKEEAHPRRQSTPRRRLLEAQLADKAFCNGSTKEKINNCDVPLTPRLMRSCSAAEPFPAAAMFAAQTRSTSALHELDECSECSDCSDCSDGSEEERLAAIVNTAREVASESLVAGTRNVALRNSSTSGLLHIPFTADRPEQASSDECSDADSARSEARLG